MKISTQMLKNLLGFLPEDLYELTNEYITEVESYEKLVSATGLVTGHVLTCVDHENSDHLHVTTVDVGTEVLQIVCGASNVASGQYVVVATPGAILPGNFEIKRSKIRGVESNGMICSLSELGIEEKYIEERFKNGIFHFDEAIELGKDPLPYLGLSGHTLELSLTPNRADLLSVLGFALDLSAVLDKKITFKETTPFEIDELNPVIVHIETEKANRYFARVIKDVKVKPSPVWLRGILIASGIRPINNVVDITNYVMLELGVPLHAFDRAKFETNKVVVRNAKQDEEIITLDGVKRSLSKEDILITNGIVPVALAGVMGLENTMVSSDTKDIILEAASFDPKSISKTSKRLDLRSDSSLRFERGIDETRVRMAINRAAELLYELANGNVTKEIAYSGIAYPKPVKITLKAEDVNKTLGISLTEVELKDLLKRLSIILVSEHTYMVPSHRNDLRIKADLIEEVARLYGLNQIPMVLPETSSRGQYTYRQKQILKIKNMMRHMGFNEVINYSLTKLETLNLFSKPSTDKIILLHPMSEDKKVLRHSLINGLIENIEYHQARQQKDLRFFEIGRTYFTHEEPLHLSAIMSGEFDQIPFKGQNQASDYFILKGHLEALLNYFQLDYKFEKDTLEGLHPGITAKIMIGKETLGYIGKVHPKLEMEAVVFEINLEVLLKSLDKQEQFKSISRYPNIKRDLAFVVDKALEVGKISDLIKQTARKYLVDLTLFDLYMDEKIGLDKKSLAYSMTFNSVEKTLETEDVDKLMRSIINRLQFEFKAEIRS